MTVVLNEVGLERFFQAKNGPVGRLLAQKAEEVRVLALENASGAIINILTGRLYEGVFVRLGSDAESVVAVVGTTAKDIDGFSYPAWHDQNGRPWLTQALRTVIPD